MHIYHKYSEKNLNLAIRNQIFKITASSFNSGLTKIGTIHNIAYWYGYAVNKIIQSKPGASKMNQKLDLVLDAKINLRKSFNFSSG